MFITYNTIVNRKGALVMPKQKEIKIVVHKPTPENADKFASILSKEWVNLIEVLITQPK